MSALDHVHTYRKYKKNLLICAHPHCTHYREKIALVGKATLCNFCGSEFILTSEDLKRSKPRCLDCSNTKEAIKHKRIKSLIDSIVPPQGETSEPRPDNSSKTDSARDGES